MAPALLGDHRPRVARFFGITIAISIIYTSETRKKKKEKKKHPYIPGEEKGEALRAGLVEGVHQLLPLGHAGAAVQSNERPVSPVQSR